MALPGIREDTLVFRVKEDISSQKHTNNDTIALFLHSLINNNTKRKLSF